MNEPITYADAGVDIDRGNRLVDLIRPLVARTRRPGADGTIGGFGGVFDLGALGLRDPLLVAANDGVGTKLKLAIETGLHATVGVDLVAMCVNDLVVQGAEPLFFLDYLATGRLDPEAAAAVVEGIAAGCEMAGCALLGGETAEMPGMYRGEDYDLAGFAVGAVERDRLLPRHVGEGDVLIGLASTGLHSNGFSLVRRIVERDGLALDAAAPFAPAVTLGAALLEPTRVYVRTVLDAIRGGGVHALAHVTGGGLAENLPRVLAEGLGARIDLSALRPQPVFGWLHAAGVAEGEMLRTFNCGIGMVVVAAPDAAERLIADLASEDARAIGTVERIVPERDERVRFDGALFA